MSSACFDDLEMPDYDVRSTARPLRDYPVQEGIVWNDDKRIRRKRGGFFAVVTLAVLIVFGLFAYALRYIPYFDISAVQVSASGGFSTVPPRLSLYLQKYMDTSLFALNARALERELESLAVVAEAKVTRRLPGTVSIQLTIEDPKMLIASVDDDDVVKGFFLVKDSALHAMQLEDFLLYGNRIFVVQVSPAYADHMVEYGLDIGIREVVRIVSGMGSAEDGNYNLITKIKYDNNSSNNFGRMVLYLPSFNASIWIREPVTVARVHEAVRLIAFEHGNDKTRNIALRGELRYDLYANSLVSRQ
jgi:hypothetical protein